MLSELHIHSCLLTSYKDNPIHLLVHVLEVVFSGAWDVMHGDICWQNYCFLIRRFILINGVSPNLLSVLVTYNVTLSAVNWDGDFKLVDDCFSCQCHAGSLLERKFAWNEKNTERFTNGVFGRSSRFHWFNTSFYVCPQNDWDKKDRPRAHPRLIQRGINGIISANGHHSSSCFAEPCALGKYQYFFPFACTA